MELHNSLRSLCFNTDWKYAVFWKLKHRARMVLTWEDGYYDKSEQHAPLESKGFGETLESLSSGSYSHDPLELAVAKMSYHVYSLGEGIVGEVAVTGRYRWIIADKHVANPLSSFELCDGWQSQFSAGIRTIVVAAVVPYGVVQLGSLNEVPEDMKLVTHIKDIFSFLQDSSIEHFTNTLECSMKNLLYLPDASTRGSDLESEVIPGNFCISEKAENKGPYNQTTFPYLQKRYGDFSHFYCLPDTHQNTAAGLANKYGGVEFPKPTNISDLEQQNQVGTSRVVSHLCGGKTIVGKDLSGGSELNLTPHIDSSAKETMNLSNVILPSEKFGADAVSPPAGTNTYPGRVSNLPDSLSVDYEKDMKKELEYHAVPSQLDSRNIFSKFSAGCELHEALGPDFFKGFLYFESEEDKTESRNCAEMPKGTSTSHMTFDSGSENLLEAVVGSVCCSSNSDMKFEKPVCESAESLLTTESMTEPLFQAKHAKRSPSYLMNQQSVILEDMVNCSSSTGVCSAMSSKEFSSTCPSACSGQLDKRLEVAKNSKKRAKPGENCRPRPRDRQLIQDRIKELRELVPNGEKCSIDSLLERTIKHMLFLESITKHADKLNKCVESKKGTDAANYERGSSWAVEVGGHLRVSSIIVENMNKTGQLLVEMLCEECSHFLEIAEAIRSLGLTILKGITEMHGEKTWICFVVEGENNRVMHRMEMLWSLVQILQQPKVSN